MLTLVTGIPAAGKTTYCEGHHCFSWDEWVKTYTDKTNVEEAGYLFAHNANGIADFAKAVIAEGTDELLVDAPICNKQPRVDFITCLKDNGIQYVKCVYLLCPVYVANDRNNARQNPISRNALYSAFASQEFPTIEEGFTEVEFLVSG